MEDSRLENIPNTTFTNIVDWVQIGNILMFSGRYLFPVLVLLGVPVNILGAHVVRTSKVLWQTTTNLYIFVLAIVDTTILLLLLPFSLHCWNLLPGYVAILTSFVYPLVKSEPWILVQIMVDRTIAVYRPLKYKQICTRQRAYYSLALIATGSFLLTILDILVTVSFVVNSEQSVILQFVIIIIVPSVLPFLIMSTLSICIVWKMAQNNQQRANMNLSGAQYNTSRISLTLLVICFTFLVLCCGQAITVITFLLLPRENKHEPLFISGFWLSWCISWIISFINHVVNFYIYSLTNQQFRDEPACKFQK